MPRRKELNTILFVIVLGFICMYVFIILHIKLQESAQKALVQTYNIYKTLEVLVLILFGSLIEYRKVILTFKSGIQLNSYYLIFTIGLIVLLVLPFEIIIKLGPAHPGSVKGIISFVLTNMSLRSVLSVLAGILTVRSLVSCENQMKFME